MRSNSLIILLIMHLHHTGWFFNWPSPEFAKCWPESNWFQKNVRVQYWPPLGIENVKVFGISPLFQSPYFELFHSRGGGGFVTETDVHFLCSQEEVPWSSLAQFSGLEISIGEHSRIHLLAVNTKWLQPFLSKSEGKSRNLVFYY